MTWRRLIVGTCIVCLGGSRANAQQPPDRGRPRVIDATARRPPLPPPLPRVDGRVCSVAFADANVILARVADVTITACDVVVALRRAAREGRSPMSRATALRELVADALMARAAIDRQLEREPTTVRRIDDLLASALLNDRAMDAMRGALPDATEVRRYYDTHTDEFNSPERAHLREIVLADEESARRAIRDAATTPFDALVRERTTTAAGRRDEGDLGLVPRGGSDRVPRGLADAGFAIVDPGGVHPEPIRVETLERVGRRHRERTVVAWHVVQLLGRLPAERVPFTIAGPRISHRLTFQRFATARAAAREALLQQLRPTVTVRRRTGAIARPRPP